MSRIKKVGLGSAALLAAVVLTAPPAPATEAHGWLVDLKYGQSTFEETFPGRRIAIFDDEADAAGVEVGYRFNDYIGLQAGYHDLGTFQGVGPFCASDDEVCLGRAALYAPIPWEAEVLGWSLAAVPSWPFTGRLSAYGKVGLLDWESDLSSAPVPEVPAEFRSFSDTDLLTALGVRYRFGERFGALLEYQRIDLDLGSTTLGVSWNF